MNRGITRKLIKEKAMTNKEKRDIMREGLERIQRGSFDCNMQRAFEVNGIEAYVNLAYPKEKKLKEVSVGRYMYRFNPSNNTIEYRHYNIDGWSIYVGMTPEKLKELAWAVNNPYIESDC